jgi:hypothetical protein
MTDPPPCQPFLTNSCFGNQGSHLNKVLTALLMMRMNSNVPLTSKGFEFNAIPSALVDINAAYCCAHAKLVSDKEKSQMIQ